jgi:hypothetical protein
MPIMCIRIRVAASQCSHKQRQSDKRQYVPSHINLLKRTTSSQPPQPSSSTNSRQRPKFQTPNFPRQHRAERLRRRLRLFHAWMVELDLMVWLISIIAAAAFILIGVKILRAAMKKPNNGNYMSRDEIYKQWRG